jgi:alpha-ketoglutarate-dependent 2,4-dichlorophenoxyacetate dioxygenase
LVAARGRAAASETEEATMETGNLVGTAFGEVLGLDIQADDLEAHRGALRQAIDEYGVLVVRDTAQDDDAFLRFAELFGTLQQTTKKPESDDRKDRAYEVSNVDAGGQITDRQSRARQLLLTARLWHTDYSFRTPSIRYTILAARTICPGGGTQFRDMRAAYDALPAEKKAVVDELVVVHDFERHHIIAGQEILPEDRERFPPVEHPLIRTHPATGRRSIYAGTHASHIAGWPFEDGRRLLDELDAFADQEQFVYTHDYRDGDIVLWDNRSVEHRQMPYDDTKYPRVMRRTAITDVDVPVGAAAA